MDNVVPITAQSWRKEYRYAVYEHKLVTEDGLAYGRSFIVIKNKYGVIVRFTRLHMFSGAYENKVFRPLASDANAKLHYICMMLNYILLDHYDLYRVNHVFRITKEMLTCFFMDYALTQKQGGGYRSGASIEKCVSSVVLFFRKLIFKYGGHVAMKKDELYKEVQAYSKNGKQIRKLVPDFQIRGVPEKAEIFRDIPTKVFKILVNLAVRYTPDIAFAIGLQAFAGLRPGEVCNVRQEGSPKGSGIIFTYLEGKLIRAEIDLTHEYAMRSDGDDAETLSENLGLWFRAYRRENAEKLRLLIGFGMEKLPWSVSRYQEFVFREQAENNLSAWRLLDFLLFHLDDELNSTGSAAIDRIAGLLDREATREVSILFERFYRWLQENHGISGWSYHYVYRRKREDLAAYTLKEFSTMAYCVFNEECWRKESLVEKACGSPAYANLWAFIAMHFVCALRSTDIVRLPKPELREAGSSFREKVLNGEDCHPEDISEELTLRTIQPEAPEQDGKICPDTGAQGLCPGKP